MNELLFQLFELPRHKPLILSIIALFIRQPLFLDQRTKHRKITETLILEKVRVLKKSSLVVFFKHGSNPSDSLLEMNVVKNNRMTVLGHLLFNFLPKADNEMKWAMSCLLRTLLAYKEENIFESVFKNLDLMVDQLENDLIQFLERDSENTEFYLMSRIKSFVCIFLDLLEDRGFKEYVLEHYILEKIAEILKLLIEILKRIKFDQNTHSNIFKIIDILGKILAKSLDPFRGFDYPNSKVPKKFNGDHMLLRKQNLVLSCRESIIYILKLLKIQKSKNGKEFLTWSSLIISLTGTQTGRYLIVFGENSSMIAKERIFAIKRKATNKLKEIIEKSKSEGFSKPSFKFGTMFKTAWQSLEKSVANGLDSVDESYVEFLVHLGVICMNLLVGDDHEIKGLSALRVFFLEKCFLKKKSIWKCVGHLLSLFNKLCQLFHIENNKNCQKYKSIFKNVNIGKNIYTELNKFLKNYNEFDSGAVGLKKLFKKKAKRSENRMAREYNRKEDEKFKLKLQKYNQILQRIYTGKFNYEEDNIVPFLSNLEFFQLNSRPMGKPSSILGIINNSYLIIPRTYKTITLHRPETTFSRIIILLPCLPTSIACFISMHCKSHTL
jgi:hypothetical protein